MNTTINKLNDLEKVIEETKKELLKAPKTDKTIDYEIDEFKELLIGMLSESKEDLSTRIKKSKLQKEFMKDFGPYIILYFMNKEIA